MKTTMTELHEKYRQKVHDLDEYIKTMNLKSGLTDEEMDDVISAMRRVNKYLRALGEPEESMYDI